MAAQIFIRQGELGIWLRLLTMAQEQRVQLDMTRQKRGR